MPPASGRQRLALLALALAQAVAAKKDSHAVRPALFQHPARAPSQRGVPL